MPKYAAHILAEVGIAAGGAGRIGRKYFIKL